MVTVETIVAFAIRDQTVMGALGEALRSDLVLAHPYLRQLSTFADDFLKEYRDLPKVGDWDVWLSTLPEAQTDGCRESLGRLQKVDLGQYTPEHFAALVLPELQKAATKTALSRLNSLPGEVPPEALAQLSEQVAAVGLHAGGSPEEEYPTLKALMQDESLLGEPDELITRLVWRGAWTVLAGEAFAGKTTLTAQGVAAFSRARPFLGDRRPGPGKVLWLNVMDEPLGLTVRRLAQEYEAHPAYVRLYDFRHDAGDLRASLVREIKAFRPDVVVIDSLIAWAQRTAKETPGSGDAAAWAEVTRPLGAMAHEHNVGLVTLHHATKDGQRYRDSTEIAAAADVLIEMSAPYKQDPSRRRFVTVSRMGGRTVWTGTFQEGSGYELGSVGDEDQAGLPDERRVDIETKVRKALMRDGGSIRGKEALRQQVKVNNNALHAVLKLMEDRGEVYVTPAGPGKAQIVAFVQSEDPGEK